jgi:hypothetical protein
VTSLIARFDTDAQNHINGAWPKVFGNLCDFGHGFAVGHWTEGKSPTPNPFGPILLVANPEILLNADDVAICLRSAGGRTIKSRFHLEYHLFTLWQTIEQI